MQLKELLKGIEVLELNGREKTVIKGIAYDSRKVSKDYLFVAIGGLKSNGHDFILKAFENGARAVVLDQDINFELPSGKTIIKVKDSREALSLVSANFYKNPSIDQRIIAITGTNGKTTISYLIEAIFKMAKEKCAVLGTVSYRGAGKVVRAERTTPESLDLHKFLFEMKKKGVRNIVMEASSHALYLKRLNDVHIDIAVFTNLTSDHLDFHKTRQEYMEAKKMLFSNLLKKSIKNNKYAVLNVEDQFGKLLSDINFANVVEYGLHASKNIKVITANVNEKGIEAKIKYKGTIIKIKSALVGDFNLSNILGAVAVASCIGIDAEYVEKGIESLSCVPGRLEKISNSKGLHIYVDYAHTDDALKNVITSLNKIKQGKVVTVFGCGGDRDREKRPKMGAVTSTLSDVTIVTSDNPRSESPDEIIEEIIGGIDLREIERVNGKAREYTPGRKYFTVIPERSKAIEKALRIMEKGDTLLIAGKGHEEYQEIKGRKIFFSDRDFVKSILVKDNTSAKK